MTLHLALLWHQHQPLYRDTLAAPPGSLLQPWARLHALRDYYAMAQLVAEHPRIHLTINLTPVLLGQLDAYLLRGATDRALELTRRRAETLTADERETVLSSFFDADWHHQIFIHPRYRDLFAMRTEARPFSAQDVRDLQVWFNLAWFGKEMRDGPVELVTGERVAVHRLVEKGSGFSTADIDDLVADQLKVMRAVVPIHRQLQDRGQIEVSVTPYYHPILPLLVDTDRGTLDRPGTCLPRPPFRRPEDAEAQVRLAVQAYTSWFGRKPLGSWPAEGAVAQFVVPLFARHGLGWIATDQGVLERSGRWGYRAEQPEIRCRPYRAEEAGEQLSIFFRDTALSDAIGFQCQREPDSALAARRWLEQLKDRGRGASADQDRIVTVALDGENAWGAYAEDGRPFLRSLYQALSAEQDVRTVTFSEYLTGDRSRGVAAHPRATHERVHDLFTGSWIDEVGSAPGVDLGTWIGEAEENRAWELLRRTRDRFEAAKVTPASAPAAFEAIYAAEGSDWFWWFGDDQDSGHDEDFDDLFRLHLANAHRAAGLPVPPELDEHIVPRTVVFMLTAPLERIQPGDRLAVVTHCPGVLSSAVDGGPTGERPLAKVGGVMAGLHRYQVTLGPFGPGQRLRFRFHCRHQGCDCSGPCCLEREQVVTVEVPPSR
jgi:alpha-amylase/alpha-mannosidase (GH57 family)